MAQSNQQQLNNLVKKQLKFLVSEYLENLSSSFTTNRKNSFHHQLAFYQNQQTKQETYLDLGSSVARKTRFAQQKQSHFSQKCKNQKKENLINTSQIEKQTQFFAIFEDNHSKIQQQPSMNEIAHKSPFNFEISADRKFGKSQQYENEHLEHKLTHIIKKNIRVNNNRVNNKSTQNLHSNTNTKQHWYNEFRDKTLVQYFYPKQKNIFRENLHNNNFANKEKDLGSQQPCKSKCINKCESQRKQNSPFLPKKKETSYITKNQCGRKINFNNYDIVSCNISLKKFGNDRTSTFKNYQKELQKVQQPDQKLLKTRMKNMEQQVYRKMPFLVQMGVKFKTAKVKL